jgi:hypothetical protein
MKFLKYLPFLFFIITACKEESSVEETPEILRLQSIRVGTIELSTVDTVDQAPIDENILLTFSNTLDRNTAEANITLLNASDEPIPLQFAYLDNDRTIAASTESVLRRNEIYSLFLNENSE